MLAGGLAQLRELLAHLSDNHAVHLALGRGVLLAQDAPQRGLQVREPVAVLQVGRGADHSMHQREVLHAQLWKEQASSGTGHHCLMAATCTSSHPSEHLGHIPRTQNVLGTELDL